MSWIESHQSLERHPKTLNLSALMAWDIDQTIGKLHRFWWWCVDYAPDGDLQKHSNAVLGAAVGLNPAQGDQFVKAMLECGGKDRPGFLEREPHFRIHDWLSYAGRFLEGRYRNRPEEWERIKSDYRVSRELLASESRVTQSPSPTPLSPSNQPLPTNQQTNARARVFEELWEVYPNKDGKKAAQRHFEASVKTDGDVLDIQTAMKNYLSSEKVQRGYVKNGSTWFNNWRDWVDYIDAKADQEQKQLEEKAARRREMEAMVEEHEKRLAEKRLKVEAEKNGYG